ncbi:hypothetical protein Agub_g12614, partial [Astrephomene gubernaculifera]
MEAGLPDFQALGTEDILGIALDGVQGPTQAEKPSQDEAQPEARYNNQGLPVAELRASGPATSARFMTSQELDSELREMPISFSPLPETELQPGSELQAGSEAALNRSQPRPQSQGNDWAGGASQAFDAADLDAELRELPLETQDPPDPDFDMTDHQPQLPHSHPGTATDGILPASEYDEAAVAMPPPPEPISARADTVDGSAPSQSIGGPGSVYLDPQALDAALRALPVGSAVEDDFLPPPPLPEADEDAPAAATASATAAAAAASTYTTTTTTRGPGDGASGQGQSAPGWGNTGMYDDDDVYGGGGGGFEDDLEDYLAAQQQAAEAAAPPEYDEMVAAEYDMQPAAAAVRQQPGGAGGSSGGGVMRSTQMGGLGSSNAAAAAAAAGRGAGAGIPAAALRSQETVQQQQQQRQQAKRPHSSALPTMEELFGPEDGEEDEEHDMGGRGRGRAAAKQAVKGATAASRGAAGVRQEEEEEEEEEELKQPQVFPPQRMAANVQGGVAIAVTAASGERVYCRMEEGGAAGPSTSGAHRSNSAAVSPQAAAGGGRRRGRRAPCLLGVPLSDMLRILEERQLR